MLVNNPVGDQLKQRWNDNVTDYATAKIINLMGQTVQNFTIKAGNTFNTADINALLTSEKNYWKKLFKNTLFIFTHKAAMITTWVII